MTRPGGKTNRLVLWSGPFLAAWLGLCTLPDPAVGAETNANALSGTALPDNASLQQVLKLCTALQEQLRATQRALDEARAEARSSAKTTADSTAERLKQMGQTLASLRQQFEQQLAAYTATNADLVRQLTRSQDAGAALQRNLEQVEARLQTLGHELAQARSGLTNETARNKQLEERASAASGAIADLTNQLARSREQETALKREGEERERQTQQTARQLAQALADLQRALATRQQFEQQAAAWAQSNAVLGQELERAREAGTALERSRQQLEQRLTAAAAELGQVKGSFQEEAIRRRVLEQQASLLLASNADLTLHLARRIEAEAGLRAQQEKLERRLEDATNRFAEVRSLMQQAQDHLEGRAREAEGALTQVRDDLARERREHRSQVAATARRHWAELGVTLALALALAVYCWLKFRRLGRTSPAPVHEAAEAPSPGAAPPPSRSRAEKPIPAPADAPGSQTARADSASPPGAGNEASVQGLIRKGLGLLNAGQAEAALKCFDEALSLDPQDSDTLVKRGTALERLERTQEAISSYEKAIGLNKCLTMAYLLKGAALLRLNRHEEAAESYRQAVTTQAAAVPPSDGAVQKES